MNNHVELFGNKRPKRKRTSNLYNINRLKLTKSWPQAIQPNYRNIYSVIPIQTKEPYVNKLSVLPIQINNNNYRYTVLRQNEINNYIPFPIEKHGGLYTYFDEFYATFSKSNKTMNIDEFSNTFRILYSTPITLSNIFKQYEFYEKTNNIRYKNKDIIIQKFYNDFYINSRDTNRYFFNSYLLVNMPVDYWSYYEIFDREKKVLSVQKKDASKRIIRNIFYREILEYTKINTTMSNKKSFLEAWKDIFTKFELDCAYFSPSVIQLYLNGNRMHSFFQQFQPKASILNPYSIYWLLDFYFPQICPSTHTLFTPVLSWGSYALAFCHTTRWNNYIATDVMPSVIEKTKKIIFNFNFKHKNFDIYQSPSEKFTKVLYYDSVDLVLLCPPYYKMEIYRDPYYNNKANNLNLQSVKSHTNYHQWIVGYWNATVINCYKYLKNNGIFAFIIGNYVDFKTKMYYDLQSDLQNIFRQDAKWVFVDSIVLENRRSSLKKNRKKGAEIMYIYRKIATNSTNF
jgi:hypothetical protein